MTDTTRSKRLTPRRRLAIDRALDELLDLDRCERESRLREIEARTPRVHRILERLVAASDDAATYLDQVVGRASEAAIGELERNEADLPPGTRIGDWRIVEPIGIGGMGMVYRAERADGAFEMSVAIKFIRAHDDPLMAERLALETQLLARLDHPNIARIVDGGTTADGRNYLVMEWIEGEDLAECRESAGGVTRECLQLFLQIAEAVAHAHQRQVVHGDIKPANIRVARDERPRLLDFGVARLLSGDRGDAAAPAALTPAFSAPEQREGRPVSTQSDVYSLGALLRWMLTGVPGTDGRPIHPRDLRLPQPRALAAIVEKAMADSPDERYRSVPEFITDVRAYLASRPVSARRYTAASRLALWARRHQAAAALAGLALVAVLVAVVGISWQARIAAAERDAARFEAERSTLLREQLVLLFREVGQNVADDDELSTRQLLQQSVRVAERLHANDPQMLVSIKALLGEIHIAMNDFSSAAPLLKAFVDYKPNLASPLMQALVHADLAQIRLRQGESEQALNLTSMALETLRDAPGRNAGRIADAMQIHGQALRGLGRWDEAIATLREAVRLARTEPGPSRLRATTRNNLATTLIYAGHADAALPHLEAALANWRQMSMEDSSSALTVMGNLATLLHQNGRISEAEPLYREAIRLRTERYGDSGALAAAHLNLGTLLALRNRPRPAREHIARGLSMISRFEGRESLSYVRAVMSRGRAELELDNAESAVEDLVEARRRFEETVGADHLFSRIAGFYTALAEARAAGTATEALAAASRRLANHRPAADRHLAVSLCERARLGVETDPGVAVELARDCMRIRRELDLQEWLVAEARALEAVARIQQGSGSGAEDLRRAREVVAAELGPDHPRVVWCDRWLDT
ncbi:MAG: protein kinase domain-containing protein [Candidatus Wenzhouxiangella sp. M2_3B_020]